MALNTDNPIGPLESGTIRAALKAIALNVATLIAVITGKTFDINAIQSAIDYGVPLATNVLSIYWGWRAIRARINATETIKTKGVSQ